MSHVNIIMDYDCIFTILFSVNGIPSTCNGGMCSSKDGSDLCRMFGNPCGSATTTTTAAPTTTTASYVSPVSCSKPCYLKSALDSIRSQVSSDVIQVNGGMGLLIGNVDLTSYFQLEVSPLCAT